MRITCPSLNLHGCSICRIRDEVADGAWCPKAKISQGIHEYLQIDLGRLKVITMVETQGRFNNAEVSFDGVKSQGCKSFKLVLSFGMNFK